MDNTTWTLLGLAAGAGGAAFAWLGARHWYGGQLEALRSQGDKAEKARQLATQQSQQMRKQIEQLQKDLAALHVRRDSAARPPKSKADRLAEAEAQLAVAAAAEAEANPARSAPPSQGFPDTQPMSRL